MVKAFEGEKSKLGEQRKVILESRQKLRAKKVKLEEQKKILNSAAKALAKAELAFDQKIDEIESINQVKKLTLYIDFCLLMLPRGDDMLLHILCSVIWGRLIISDIRVLIC